MDKIRVRYSKTGKARYISHLDLATAMQRSFLRAGVALKYSEGFNPHPYISVALPLSVGTESICELMDVALEGGTIGERVNGYMPEGLRVHNAYRPWRSFNDIKWIDLQCLFHYNAEIAPGIERLLAERFSATELIITKRTKRGESLFDAAPHIKDVATERTEGLGVKMNAKISAQNPTISHKDILSIIRDDSNLPQPDAVSIKRIEIYDTNMVLFK